MASENLKGVHDWGVENGKFKETHMTPKEYRKSKSSPARSKALEKKVRKEIKYPRDSRKDDIWHKFKVSDVNKTS